MFSKKRTVCGILGLICFSALGSASDGTPKESQTIKKSSNSIKNEQKARAQKEVYSLAIESFKLVEVPPGEGTQNNYFGLVSRILEDKALNFAISSSGQDNCQELSEPYTLTTQEGEFKVLGNSIDREIDEYFTYQTKRRFDHQARVEFNGLPFVEFEYSCEDGRRNEVGLLRYFEHGDNREITVTEIYYQFERDQVPEGIHVETFESKSGQIVGAFVLDYFPVDIKAGGEKENEMGMCLRSLQWTHTGDQEASEIGNREEEIDASRVQRSGIVSCFDQNKQLIDLKFMGDGTGSLKDQSEIKISNWYQFCFGKRSGELLDQEVCTSRMQENLISQALNQLPENETWIHFYKNSVKSKLEFN